MYPSQCITSTFVYLKEILESEYED